MLYYIQSIILSFIKHIPLASVRLWQLIQCSIIFLHGAGSCLCRSSIKNLPKSEGDTPEEELQDFSHIKSLSLVS